MVDTLAINYNPHFWGEDSAQFKPSRLKGISSTEVRTADIPWSNFVCADVVKLRYNLFTFGFGSRKCLGKHFAEAMMKGFVCELISQYEIRVSDKSQLDTTTDKAQATWVPVSGIKIALVPVGSVSEG